ncbi:MAG: carboxypeptidase-like regulatory domain-containing protein [Phocaeicola vulgatus]
MKDKTLSSNYSFKGTIWLFMLVLSSFMYVANAQQRNVQGMVTDPNGEPIIGASVVVKGTTNGTITDFDGKFILSNVPEKGIITITYIGYKGTRHSSSWKKYIESNFGRRYKNAG